MLASIHTESKTQIEEDPAPIGIQLFTDLNADVTPANLRLTVPEGAQALLPVG